MVASVLAFLLSSLNQARKVGATYSYRAHNILSVNKSRPSFVIRADDVTMMILSFDYSAAHFDGRRRIGFAFA